MKIIGWLLGLDNVTSIELIDVSFAAAWAQQGFFWLCFAAAAMFAGAITFYRRFQLRGSRMARFLLGLSRGLLLTLLLVTLAGPVLRMTAERTRRPTVYLLFDGTESMTMRDKLPDAQRAAIDAATGRAAAEQPTAGAEPPSRLDYVQALLRKEDDNLLERLQRDNVCRLEAFVFDGQATSQLRRLDAAANGRLDPRRLATRLEATGQVTALGAALQDVRDQIGAGQLAAVVMFSDFAQNSGPSPLAGELSRGAAIDAPLHAVGVGAEEAVDLAIELQTDPKMKKAERTIIYAKVRQVGVGDRSVAVTVTARPLSGAAGGQETVVGRRQVTLAAASQTLEFPFTPAASGLFEFAAQVETVEGEVVEANNRATRQLNIIDDYLRLMFVAFEPSWEWRFVKEVFHRDRLVGMNGFRTYLSSSDPRVRQSNVLFLDTLTPRRSDFFANDVIFLGDMPESSLTPRFCEMAKEFVSTMGGGLVVVGGPRFGPAELARTPLGDMLPVIADAHARLRDKQEFQLRLAPQAVLYPFMQLGSGEAENRRAWDNLGPLPWYQPVAALHEQAVALAVHPSDRCADGKTPQPLIAIRRYGKGEVVYFAFDEMWRLRRRFGELYYRQFWSQLIYRLGMSHALGADKRFVARVDRPEYRVEERVRFTVEAYDENYEPLTDEDLPEGTLVAELTLPDTPAGPGQARTIAVPFLRQGVFEANIPVYAPGDYSIRVQDPVTGNEQRRRFQVTDSSAEHRSGVRNVLLQEQLARETGGRAYDLTTVGQLVDELPRELIVDRETRNHALWTTPLWFILVVGLMLSEWLARRMVNLR